MLIPSVVPFLLRLIAARCFLSLSLCLFFLNLFSKLRRRLLDGFSDNRILLLDVDESGLYIFLNFPLDYLHLPLGKKFLFLFLSGYQIF